MVMVLCAVILGLRREGALSNPQLWGEDSYFFRDAYSKGFHALTMPFAGYLHTVPRIIAEVAMSLNPVTARWTFALSAFVVTLYVASRALSKRSPFFSSYGIGALAVVLVPDTYEVYLNLVNLQWIIGASLLLLLISSDPEKPREWIHDVVAAVAAGLTGPFSLFFLPLFLLRALFRRTRPSALLASVIGGCALIQCACLFQTSGSATGKTFSDIAGNLILPAIGRRVGGSVLIGSLLSPDTDLYIGSVVGVATIAGLCFLSLAPGRFRLERCLLGLASGLLLAASFYRQRFVLDRFFIPDYGARYFYVPQLILIWLLVLAFFQTRLTGMIPQLLLCGSFLLNLPRYRDRPYLDTRWSLYDPSIREGKAVVVPINPPGWVMILPAREK
jgi:hypothetical protein